MVSEKWPLPTVRTIGKRSGGDHERAQDLLDHFSDGRRGTST